MLYKISFASARGRAFSLLCGLVALTMVGVVCIYSFDHGYFSSVTYNLPLGVGGSNVRSRFESYLQKVHHEIHKEDVREFCSQENFDKAFIASAEQRYKSIVHGGIKPVFVAVNLYNSEKVLPNMALQLLALADTLGHSRVFISIYENGSKDRTKEILHRFNSTLNDLGIAHQIRADATSKPEHIHRIEYLAKVRNFALEPLHSTGTKYGHVLFINDIYFCVPDLLELVYQSRAQSTHLTCAEDYDMFNDGPGFYDTWVTRDMRGQRLSKEVQRISGDEKTLLSQIRDRPFQVQCCWNGAALIDAQVFHGDDGLRFRRSAEDECSASECSLLCNDMWKKGFKRAIVVPRVKVSYDIKTRNKLREPVSFPADLPYNRPEAEKVSFRSGPNRIECFPLNGIDSQHPDGPAVYVDI